MIMVIGNVTPEQAKAAVEKYFGDWKAIGARSANRSPAGAGEFAGGYGCAGQEPRASECDVWRRRWG